MNTEKIQALRRKIAISITTANELLLENNQDVLLAETMFHEQNIKKIADLTGCDDQEVAANYKICGFDVVKTITRLQNKGRIITTRANKSLKNEIGFILYPKAIKKADYHTKRSDVFIPTADFDYIINEFRQMHPDFDIYGHNYFDTTACNRIIDQIKQLKTTDETVNQFLAAVVDWFDDALKKSDIIVVYGNL
jgi:hypothetical protein